MTAYVIGFLIPAVAIGMCLGALAQPDPRRAVRHGLRLVGTILAMWAVLSLMLAVAEGSLG